MGYDASPAIPKTKQEEDEALQNATPPQTPGGQAIGGNTGVGVNQQPGAAQPGPAMQTPQQTAGSTAATGIQSKPAASGGFTNLQNYMNQNKNAGQQLANRIGTGVNRDIGTSVGNTTKALTSTEQANAAAQKDVATGQGILKNISGESSYTPTSAAAPAYLNPYMTSSSPSVVQAAEAAKPKPTPAPGPKFDAASIANDPAKLAEYNAFRLGHTQAADQAKLAQTLADAETRQGSSQKLVGNLANQLGSSASRGDLLSQYVNRNPQYSRSAQNLDTYFLSKDRGGLSNLQNQVKDVQSNKLKNIADKINKLQTGSPDISAAGTGVSTGIQNKSNENTQALLDQLTGEIGGVNDQRAAEQAWAKAQYGNLQSGGSIDPEFAKRMGLTQGQSLYNLDQNDLGSYANLSPTKATSYSDVANQDDVSQYAALAKLAGVDPSAFQLQKPSSLIPSVAARTDNSGNLAQLSANRQNEIAATNYGGHGVYDLPQFGGGFNAPVLSDANITGANAQNIFNQYGITDAASLASFGNNQNPVLASAFGNLSAGDQGNADLIARRNALSNALTQLTNSGYFKKVNIGSSGQESDKPFNVT